MRKTRTLSPFVLMASLLAEQGMVTAWGQGTVTFDQPWISSGYVSYWNYYEDVLNAMRRVRQNEVLVFNGNFLELNQFCELSFIIYFQSNQVHIGHPFT